MTTTINNALRLVLLSALLGVSGFAYADTLAGPDGATVDNAAEYTLGPVDASGFTNLMLSFDYNAEALDNGDSFTYGWRTLADGDNDLATFVGVNEGGPVGDETGVVLVPLPADAQDADLEVYVSVAANSDGASDFVEITNVTITGDVVPACAPQYDVAGPTAIQNTDTGEYFNTISDAIDDCDTDNGDTILLSDNVNTSAQITIDKEVTLDGGGFTLSPLFPKSSNSNNSAIGIINTDNVTVQNLTIDGSGGSQLHGINAYLSNGVVIDNVASKHNRSGLVVNGSEVTATDYRTEGNVWHAINVAQGGGVTDQAKLTIHATSEHAEVAPTPHIFIDDVDYDWVVDDVDGQYTYTEFPFPSLAKPDRIARAYYLDTDLDDDGVENGIDLCPDTTADEFPGFEDKQAKNRWMLNDSFEWVTNGKPGTQGDFMPTIEDTKGCSGEQILESMSATLGEDFGGHYEYGLSKGLLEAWIAGVYYVGPTYLETVEVPANDADGVDSVNALEVGTDYFLNAYGTANAGDGIEFDAQYSFRTSTSIEWTDAVSTYEGLGTGLLDLFVDGADVDWGPFNPTHEYEYMVSGADASVNLTVNDVFYPNNTGSLFVDIYEDLWVDLW